MDNLEVVIAAQLTICEALYNTGRQARQVGVAAAAWADALAKYLDYPYARKILIRIFQDYRANESCFPTPEKFGYALALARHRIIRDWWEQVHRRELPMNQDSECLASLVAAGDEDGNVREILKNIIENYN